MPTFTVAIKGVKFRPPEAREVAHNLTPHEVVAIVPDPFNEWDANALKIVAHKQFIGFVQKDMAAYIAPMLGGEQIVGYVSEYKDPSGLHFIEISIG